MVVGVLHTRDLSVAAIELAAGRGPIPVRALMTTSLIVSFRHVTLDVLLREFRSGRAHLCIVRNLPGENSFTGEGTAGACPYRLRSTRESIELRLCILIPVLSFFSHLPSMYRPFWRGSRAQGQQRGRGGSFDHGRECRGHGVSHRCY